MMATPYAPAPQSTIDKQMEKMTNGVRSFSVIIWYWWLWQIIC